MNSVSKTYAANSFCFQDVLKGVEEYKRYSFLMGRMLQEAKLVYKDLVGEGINSWSDFLAQPEIGMSVREANSLIKLVELTQGLGVPLNDLNLATARFCANKGILEPDLVDDMKVLSIKDWKERHHEEKTDNAPQTYEYMVMKRSKETGNLSRVYGENAEELVEKYKDKIHADF